MWIRVGRVIQCPGIRGRAFVEHTIRTVHLRALLVRAAGVPAALIGREIADSGGAGRGSQSKRDPTGYRRAIERRRGCRLHAACLWVVIAVRPDSSAGVVVVLAAAAAITGMRHTDVVPEIDRLKSLIRPRNTARG